MIYYNRFPLGNQFALTAGYDDGAVSDRRLVETFNKYGIKGTFSLFLRGLIQTDTSERTKLSLFIKTTRLRYIHIITSRLFPFHLLRFLTKLLKPVKHLKRRVDMLYEECPILSGRFRTK